MSPSFSIYLDIVRFFAAGLVFMAHVRHLHLVKPGISYFGHEAVVIFFVLSGYVISHVTAAREKDLKTYAIARMSRIYSVAVPALLLTLLFDRIGRAIDPAPYAAYFAYDLPLVRFLSSLFFTSELWNVSIQAFTNVPYWSLNYEVWYYVGFAFLAFTGKPGRYLFVGLCLLLGPKILVMMPIWWFGVAIHRWSALQSLRPRWGWLLLALSAAAFVVLYENTSRKWGFGTAQWFSNLGVTLEWSNSRRFLADIVLGLIVAVHFVGARAVLASAPDLFRRIEKPVRFLAGTTFTLYLLHQPVLLLFAALFGSASPSLGKVLLATVPAFAVTVGLGAAIESRKGLWKRGVTAAWNKVEGWVRRVQPAGETERK